MYKYALINKQNIVENVVVWDGQAIWSPPENMLCLNVENTECGIGWIYDGSSFTAPQIVVLTPVLIIPPTKAELLFQLNALSAQIQTLT